jgi:hypothetical protein
MASGTVTLGVDQVTAQAYQRPILPLQIQRNGRNGQALLNPALGIILLTLVLPGRAGDR